MNNLPSALKPVYTTAKPNQNILLYDGLLEISSHLNQYPVQVQGNGKLEYVWFPSPCIKFKFSNQEQNIDLILCAKHNNYPISLTLSNLDISFDVFCENISSGGSNGNHVSGRIKKPVVQGKGQDLAYIIFHVANFHEFYGGLKSILNNDLGTKFLERVVLEDKEWKLILNQLETTEGNVKLLNAQGGFAITHVGKLEKLDGQAFSGKEATDFLKVVADFLSFARGFRVPLILLRGYDAEDNEIWQHWNSSIGHYWKYVDSWFPTNKAKILAKVFPGFLRWWRDWEESEKLALYWYLEANHISLSEQKIILTQVALESIAYKEGMTNGKASDKLRQLLEKFKIPTILPFDKPSKRNSSFADSFRPQSPPLLEKLIQLKQKCEQEIKTNEQNKQQIEKKLNQVDAPYLFTQIRNDIIHPKEKIENLETYLYEASDLGLWYLELVLLAIFDYQGDYHNRLPRYQQNGEIEPVPWSNL